MLENVVLSGTGTKANFRGMTIAGKTGTTSSRKDLWFAGYTPYYTAVVWTGYDQQIAVRASGNPSAVLWKKVMEKAHANLSFKNFNSPPNSNLVTVEYCKVSGLRATAYCGSNVGAVTLLKEDIPRSTCNIHTQSTTEPKPFDVNDESTWPKDDPNFNPEDPATWPSKPSEGEENEGEAGEEGETPAEPTNPDKPENNSNQPPAEQGGEEG